ncbi:MAG: DUF4147 domain-containing protein [Thermoplasmata archaeon]|nr:DUF4147 domain-containing protein [Thermoplasmata archaeon]
MEIENERSLCEVRHNPLARKDFLSVVKAGVASVDAYMLVRKKLSFDGKHLRIANSIFRKKGRIFVVGAGKVAHLMAAACADEIEECTGCVLCPEEGKHGGIKFFRATHPLASEQNLKGTEKVLEVLKEARKDDFVLFVISGGASAMLAKPVEGLGLQEKNEIVKGLMLSGANIRELNTVRKHLSEVKGGRAAIRTEATVIGLVLSDVPEGNIGDVGSGPTVPDRSTKEEALRILKKYGILDRLSESARKAVLDAAETPKASHPRFRNVRNFIVGNMETALAACVQRAEELGYDVRVITPALDAEAREVGKLFAEMLNYEAGRTGKRLYIAVGETYVRVCGTGKGGRNLEVVLGFLKKLNVKEGVILSFATDGKDGTTEWAGAFGDLNTIEKAGSGGLEIDDFLAENNSMGFFEKTGDYVIAKNTRTNVGDIVVWGWRGENR